MIGSGILDVAIGVVLMYLLLSLICSIITEGISRFFAIRANTLEAGIRNLLNDPDRTRLASKIYSHPLIRSLAKESNGDKLLNTFSSIGRWSKPAYIPSRTFALALLDIVTPDKDDPERLEKLTPERLNGLEDGGGFTNDDLPVKRALVLLTGDVTDDVETALKRVESWYDDTMERVSSWYKRKTQVIIFITGAIVVVALNADTFVVANQLWTDSALRESLVSAAQQVNDTGQIEGQISKLPLGRQYTPDYEPTVIAKIMGLWFTTLAVALGAPFWFDVLAKIIRVRSSLKPSEKPSKDLSGEK